MAQTEQQQAFFTAIGDELHPGRVSRSWWNPAMIHGRLLGGLAARTLEREQSEPGLHFSRLTVDLFRNAPLAPVTVETTRIRDGRRIRVADALVHAENGLVARATAVLLRTGEQPHGPVPATPAWDAPPPEELWEPRRQGWAIWRFDEHNQPLTSTRGAGKRRAWLRESRELVAGEALSPFVRAALAADTASPLAHASEHSLDFINADYTLSLSRLPLSDAIGLESSGHLDEDGIAVGHCTLHDTAGPIGFCHTTALANPR
ncbi:thioesterase family protein [Amycolatopsis endophytica]|uniref:Thioesterase n=1 Tax=Amycolatopsis endophytica TaxID=860233 RepID=A0A853B8W4_9PSEU|nr:thioesterase family protein [Amycolatopsis endophytica]NYI91235.1 hypothetical protein [Amycolatopsis endophytica]